MPNKRTISSTPQEGAATRKLKQPQYKSFRLSKRIKHPKPKLPSAFRIFRSSLGVVLKNWKLFGGITLIYFVLTLLLVRGFDSVANINEVKDSLGDVLTGTLGGLAAGVTLFGVLLGTANSPSSDIAGAYQSILLLMVSLATIWALRQRLAGVAVGIRDSFYKGLYPVVPFLLVLLVIGVQLLPLVIAGELYTIVFSNGIAATLLEKVLWILLFGLMALWSVYMVTSSTFALYIVTLPDVRPLQALRSARGLVRFRRWMVMRKVLFLPFALLLTGLVIMLPVLLWLTPAAELIYLALSMLGIVQLHAYMYCLYRELIA